MNSLICPFALHDDFTEDTGKSTNDITENKK